MLLLIAFRRRWPVWLFIATNLLTVTIFWSFYRLINVTQFPDDHSDLTAFTQVAQEQMHYDPNAANPWCNTLLFNVKDYTYHLAGVPGGLGLTFYWTADDPKLKFKSGYLLLDEADAAVIRARPDAPDLQALAETGRGTLYRNRSAGCDISGESS
jgi:hypothetical protein